MDPQICKEAYKQVPSRWYERESGVLASATIAGFAMLQIEKAVENEIVLVWTIKAASAAIYIIGRVADSFTTQQALDFLQTHDNPLELRETNRHVDTRNAYKYGVLTTLDMLFCVAAVVSPTVGVTIGVASLVVALSNHRTLARTKAVANKR